MSRDARLRRLARQLHALGERPLYELLRELDGGADLWPRLEAYARLPACVIYAFNGDALPSRPDIFLIEGGARQ